MALRSSHLLPRMLTLVWLVVPGVASAAEKTSVSPQETAARIDRVIDARLAEAKVRASDPANDAEFLRRVTLDLTGCIPTAEQTVAFLSATDPDKRSRWIDELLTRPEHGRHFARTWARLITAEEPTQRPLLEGWLTEQFNSGRGWNEIVAAMLTATGKGPETAFVLSNVENKVPEPSKLAGATARLFLGVQLQCAECHKHPFSDWKQDDFWGLAAFFSATRVQTKPEPLGLVEGPADAKKPLTGAVITIPAAAGKAVGKKVKARYLLGDEPNLEEAGPYRPALAEWLTSPDNSFFARAAVNRLWGQLFGRGLVNPVDDLHDDNPPTHPEVLQTLADEFVASGFDLKHLLRCICLTQAYQRDSRGTEGAEELYGRMANKVMGPDALYDSLTRAMGVKELAVVQAATYGSGRGGAKTAGKVSPREQFVKAFSTQDPETTPIEFTHGIPQALILLNDRQFNDGAPVIDALMQKDSTPEKMVENLFLTVLNRRPTDAEQTKFVAHVTRQTERRTGYAAVLWVLLNTPEFVLIP